MGLMPWLPPGRAARRGLGWLALDVRPITGRGPGGVLGVLLELCSELAHLGFEGGNALLIVRDHRTDDHLQRRSQLLPQVFRQQRGLLGRHASSSILPLTFPQVCEVNGYATSKGGRWGAVPTPAAVVGDDSMGIAYAAACLSNGKPSSGGPCAAGRPWGGGPQAQVGGEPSRAPPRCG